MGRSSAAASQEGHSIGDSDDDDFVYEPLL